MPILTALALSGRLGEGPEGWDRIPQLPFELAACPHHWFAALKLPVVSYALPALIAIGQVRHARRPSWNPVLRPLRNAVRERTLRLLREIQPTSGGYLEATPLTSFVVMSLIGAGQADHPVVASGVEFLIRSDRADGSWAIDSNLATWVTTLSVRALGAQPDSAPGPTHLEQETIRNWLLQQQYREEHPYTHAAPGGWAWTDLPGGVPDADDTPGALCALKLLDNGSDDVSSAVSAGVRWLLDLQNSDGGLPTFCRGWGALPFDQSSADLTAHTLRAWRAWEDRMPASLRTRIISARRRALAFLKRRQHVEGYWLPLWFGNQHAPNEVNATYGTSRVLLALIEEFHDGNDRLYESIQRGAAWLLSVQNDDGGWGGATGCPSSIEETAFTLETIATITLCEPFLEAGRSRQRDLPERLEAAIERGARSLIQATANGCEFAPSPIGFYFAKLWYYESLYPVVFTVAALGQVRSFLQHANDAPPAKDGSLSRLP